MQWRPTIDRLEARRIYLPGGVEEALRPQDEGTLGLVRAELKFESASERIVGKALWCQEVAALTASLGVEAKRPRQRLDQG